jgi:SOS-response transcriptional repressor LexA
MPTSDPATTSPLAAPLATALRRHRRARRLTLQQLADAAGCSKSYLSTIENARRDHPPSAAVLNALEDALRLKRGQLGRLADWQQTPESVKRELDQLRGRGALRGSPTDAPRRFDGALDLDAMFRSGALHRRAAIDADAPIADSIPLRSVPLINKVAAGYPTEFTDLGYPAAIADAYVPCPNLDDPHAFAARVVGRSMEPHYLEGQTLVFSPATEPSEGDDCFVRILPDHHTTFKRVSFPDENRVTLEPLNPEYPTSTIRLDQVSGLYPAVMRIERLGAAGHTAATEGDRGAAVRTGATPRGGTP